MSLFLILFNLISVKTACVTPNITGSVIENHEYFAGELIFGESLNEGTKISHDGGQQISTCVNGNWDPEIPEIPEIPETPEESEIEPSCVIGYTSRVDILDHKKGDIILEGRIVRFQCYNGYIAIGTGRSDGISICTGGILSPPVECFQGPSFEKKCLVSDLKNAFGIREIIDHYKYSVFVEHGIYAYFICEENFTSEEETILCSNNEFVNMNQLCLKKCDTSIFSDKNAQIINPVNFVNSGDHITYSCPETHPISKNDKENTFDTYTKTGIGSILCNNGTFVGIEEPLCYKGCIVPSDNSDERYLQNGDTLNNFECNHEMLDFNCVNNELNPPFDCMNGVPSIEIPDRNFPVYGIVGRNLYDTYHVLYTCPSTHPISTEDKLDNKYAAKSFGTFDSSTFNQYECYEGCIIPEEIIFQYRFVLNGETIINFRCPPGKLPNTGSSTCVGTSFNPIINCMYDAKPGENKNVCLIPKLNDPSITQKSIAVGSDLHLICNTLQFKLKCMPDGDFSPRIPTSCLSGLKSDFIAKACYRQSVPNSISEIPEYRTIIFHGEIWRFTCYHGYSISTGFSNFIDVTCDNNNLNIDGEFECIPKHRIKKNLFDAIISKSVLALNEPLKLECVTGFVPFTESIKWDGNSYSITEKNICRVECELPYIANGEINQTQIFYVNKDLEYTCHKNHIKQTLELSVCKEIDGKKIITPEPKCCCATKFANICTSCAITYALIAISAFVPFLILIICFAMCWIKVRN